MNAFALDIPVLETERLILRAPSIDDFEADVEFYATERSAGVGGPQPRDQVWRNLAARIGHWVMRGYGYWAVDEKATSTYCGRVGLWFPDGWPEREIGWTLMGHAEGRGIAHEAAIRVRTYAYETLGWTTAISLIAPTNERSKTLARRLGATLDSIYEHPSYGPVEIYRHPGPGSLSGALR
jgi:RimJ/RimL family protein N-acetyltransferase